MTAPRPLLSKIKSPQALRRILKKSRAKKGQRKARLVFTNGCFDLLHRGHVTYLQKARKLGTLLVVALNDDASVGRLGKGPGRPLNTLSDRMTVMAALECVDYVTWFEEDTPLNAIRVIHPDVLVKGGDWQPREIVGSEDVLGWGGKVRSLPYLKGHSTTATLAKIR